MGASGWEYFTPYQDDITAAFRDVQHREYQEYCEGRVSRSQAIADLREYLDEPAFSTRYPSQEEQEGFREYINERIQRLEALPEPTTIDEQITLVREIEAEQGTGSILDMNGISEHAEYFRVAPLTVSELLKVFGTEKPDHDLVVKKREAIMDFLPSQMGSYVIVFKDDRPDEIYFAGFSGD